MGTERRFSKTIPAGVLMASDVEAQAQQHPPPIAVPLDPNLAVMAKAIDTLSGLSKIPGAKGPTMAGILSGVVAAAVFVFAHDMITRGNVTSRLDQHDRVGNGLIDAVNGLLDEGEADMECMTASFEALQQNKAIPKCSTRGKAKIRRDMPAKIPE